jgi:acetylornithine deacetylase/succinyl-diaminopimelate desuccinylase-like protein
MGSSDMGPRGIDPEFLTDLAHYVAIPSVSRDSDPATMRAAADFLAAQLAFADGRVTDGAGNPVVRGDWLGAPGRPTVLVYGHYDVQPEGDHARWHSPPFELTADTHGGTPVLRGRGVTDDKGPVLVVLAMARDLLAREGALPLNVKFLFEGEEEIGSPNLPAYVAAHAAELAADLVISADGAMWRPDSPSLPIGSKGLLGFDIEVTGPERDLHSGRYGGIVANPALVLASLITSLRHGDGSIAVAGFYDGVPPLSIERRAEIAAVDFDEGAFLAAAGAGEPFGEPGYSTLERLWERPTLELNGIRSGATATVIPAVATAHLTCRLVPGQDPQGVFDAIHTHLTARPDCGTTVRIVAEPGAVPAYRIPADHPAIRAGVAALESLAPPGDAPRPPVLLDVVAGTLPCTTMFEELLGIKTMLFSFSTSDENLHGPDEFFRVPRIAAGMRAWEQLWRLLADGPHRLTTTGATS